MFKGRVSFPISLCCQGWVLETTAATKVQGESEPEMSRERGKAQAAACPGIREPPEGSASRALLASNSRQALGKQWDQLGIHPHKSKKGSLPVIATGNHEQARGASWAEIDGRSHRQHLSC